MAALLAVDWVFSLAGYSVDCSVALSVVLRVVQTDIYLAGLWVLWMVASKE